MHGRLPEAIDHYTQAIAADPGLIHAYRNRAAVLLALQRADAALADLDEALVRDAGYAEAHNLRAATLLSLNRPAEAALAAQTALNLKPGYVHALNNLGMALEASGRPEEALAFYGQALQTDPEFLPPLQNGGNLLARLGRRAEALQAFDRAIGLAPADAELRRCCGLVFQGLCLFDQALEQYDIALAIRPSADAHIDRGNALVGLDRRPEAIESFERALDLSPGLAEAAWLKGLALREMILVDEARPCFELVLKSDADDARSYNARGLALRELGRFEEALAAFDQAVERDPGRADAHHNRGVALKELGRTAEAIVAYDHAISLAPAEAQFRLNRGMELLSLGHYAEGWAGLEWRKQMRGRQDMGYRVCPAPEWSGAEPLAGKTLFVHSEQGLGDSLQYCRYLTLAMERGASVVYSVQDRLIDIVSTLSPAVKVIGARQEPEVFDYHISVMSLPWAFKTDASNIPAQTPYLWADQTRVANWRSRLGAQGFKIGVAWQGSMVGTAIGKAFHPEQLRSIAKIPGVRLISLQKGTGSEALAELKAMSIEDLGEDFDSGSQAFLDTAAVMESLDLVITTDTSVAHLAGALGRPTWVALKFIPDCRWGLQGSETAWYPTMRFFRQPSRGDWDSVFAEMATALSRA